MRAARKVNVKDASSISLRNLNIVFFAVCLFAAIIVAQLFRWQIINHAKLKAQADALHRTEIVTEAKRGSIFAADETVLAIDEPAWILTFELSSVDAEREVFFRSKDDFSNAVAEILNVPVEDLSKYFTDDFRYYKFPQKISDTQKEALENIDVFVDEKGHSIPPTFVVRFTQTERRVYPNNRLASHVLGFIQRNEDDIDVGAYGIQGYFYGDLKSGESISSREIDAGGSAILTADFRQIEAREGKDIVLTIRPHIQMLVESELKKQVEKYQAKSGSLILMNPQTGEILAMANYPDYNPAQYWLVEETWVLKNKSVADLYEPGSVFKPLTVSIGLQTGTIDRDYICHDNTGYYTLYEGTQDERRIYTWDRNPDGDQKLQDILKNSNNPCIAQISQKIGLDEYYPYFERLGIGKKINIGLQDEANSYVKPKENWIDLDLAVASFGQGQSITPLQMISAFSTIANTNGDRMQPYIIKEIRDEHEVIKTQPKVLQHIFDSDIVYDVQDMLEYTVTKGDAKWIMTKDVLPYYAVAGKTGTAQIALGNGQVGYETGKNNTTFIGFAPTHGAQIIMLLRLEEAQVGSFSTENVVPAWVAIFNKIAPELGLPTRDGIPAQYQSER